MVAGWTRTLRLRLHSLRVAIAASVVAGVFLSVFVSYLEQTSDLRQAHLTQIRAEMDSLGVLAALALREPLWQFESEQANSIMEAAFTDPDVVSIDVWDDKGTSFAKRQRTAEDPELVIQGERLIERNGVNVGRLQIQMSTAGYLRKLDAVRTQYLRSAVQISVGALVVILLLMHWRLVRPLDRLVQASGRIAQGQLDVPIRAEFKDEVGALADSLEATRRSLLHLIAQLESRNAALIDANEHLEQRVRERTLSLETTLATLERAQEEIVQTEKLASLGRVVAGVAHELNTPIGNALTICSALQADVDAIQAELGTGSLRRTSMSAFMARSHEGHSLAVNNLQRAARLIADFKQVAVDQTSDQQRTFDLAEVTSEVLNMLQPTIRKSAIDVVKQLEPALRCDSYPGRYSQVLTNLVMNAATHAFEAGQPGQVHVAVARVDAHHVELVVSDNGCGMTDDVRARMFDPFFTTKMGRGGTGLGMHIVHTIVTRVLAGHITVTSQPGVGTQVRVVFPSVLASADQGAIESATGV